MIYLEKGMIIYPAPVENQLLSWTEFLTCPQYEEEFYFNTSNPGTVLMEDLVDVVVNGENEFPLEEVSGITPQEFYDTYRVPNTTICIEGQGGTEQ